MPSSTYTDGVGASSVARAGSNKAWVNPTNGLHHDFIYTTAGTMVGGDKSENLVVASLPPASALASLPTLVQVKVEGFQNPLSGWTIRDDHVQLTNSGVLIGSDARLLTTLELTETSRVYNFDISGTGVTLADINAGNLGLQYGDTCYPLSPTTFSNPANWSITFSPTSPIYVEQLQPIANTTVVRLTAAWTGTPGLQPEGIILSVTTSAVAGGLGQRIFVGPPPVYNAGFSGTASVDNGQGDTASGAIESPTPGPPEFQGVTGTHNVYILLDQGGGTYGYHDFTMTANATLSPSDCWGYYQYSYSATIPTQPPVTVSIDSIQSSYTVTASCASRHHFNRIPNIGMRAL